MKLKLSAALLMLLQACNLNSATTWPHAALSETCAPYDGAALNIFSVAPDNSQLSINVYSGLSSLPGSWSIAMGATSNSSALSVCQDSNGKKTCQFAQSGTLKVRGPDKNGIYSVSFDAVLSSKPESTTLKGQLTASLQLPKEQRHRLCG